MPHALTLRRAEARDVPALARFNVAMARETEGKTLNPGTVEAGVETLLRRPELGFYLVAEQRDRLAAALMITTEWSDWRASLFWWIQSVYVHPDFRRQGVFTALYEDVQARAAETPDVCGLRLYVDQENEAARRTYEALGMAETPYRFYEAMLQ